MLLHRRKRDRSSFDELPQCGKTKKRRLEEKAACDQLSTKLAHLYNIVYDTAPATLQIVRQLW
jgi:hypothetical protein